jgi:methylenetetrahydrofolate reductase (NADPH)
VSKSFYDAIRSNGFVVTAECAPPRGAGIDGLAACASSLSGLVNAIDVPECEDGVRMSALAACGHLIAAGAEPILHLLTRDMNRIALQAALLGAASMGVKNVLCTAGRHQALTSSRSARGVFDVDPIQLLAIANGMRKNGELADGRPIDGKVDFLLGTDTNPFSDPVELQVMTLEKAVAAGADFVITQPVFRLDKFNEWMKLVRDKGLHERVCIIASVLPLASAQQATELAETYRHLDIGGDVLKRLESTTGPALASETATALKAIDGVRGICIMSGEDGLAKEILTTSGITGS